MTFIEWIDLGYLLTGAIGAIGYMGQLKRLIALYRSGGTNTDLSVWAFACWAFGSLLYVAYSLWSTGRWLMVLVSGSALALNLLTLVLVVLIQQRGKDHE